MTIQAAHFHSGQLDFRPIGADTVEALLAGDISVVTAAEGWPHSNTMLGLRMGAAAGLPFWLIELDGRVIGDCGTVGPPNSEGEVEIGCGLSDSYRDHRGEVVRGLTAWLHSQPGITTVVGESEESAIEEPPVTLTDPRELLAGYLDYYRNTVLRKLDGMTDGQLRTSQVASGWTPLGLLNHLTLMEMRWFRWGFLAEQIDQPWGGGAPGSDWQVPADRTSADVIAAFRAETERTRAIVADASLDAVAATGGRFSEFGDRPTLAWILFHVLQEYARHAGHLDIARELADGATGK